VRSGRQAVEEKEEEEKSKKRERESRETKKKEIVRGEDSADNRGT